MAGRIEDYAFIGDARCAALVGRDGSVDWACMPRFDSDACFAALLGDERHGRWQLAPRDATRATGAARRCYRQDSLVLETTFATERGVVRVIDFMPPGSRTPHLVRVVECVKGAVAMAMDLRIRFGYGAVLPWVQRMPGGVTALAGPDALSLFTDVPLTVEDATVSAEFTVAEGQKASLVLGWHPSIEAPARSVDALRALDDTDAWWRGWCAQCTYEGAWREDVMRSLITLRALTFLPTGGIIAAPTTSLPERLGGVRNWDYRYCWLRDATFTLLALLGSGFREAAASWCGWLLRAVAGHPSQLQIMYGPSGERRLSEIELPWLPGYEGAAPVRIGNAAAGQLQLDVFGEVMNCIYQAREDRMAIEEETWHLQRALLHFLEKTWQEPDSGIWEVRGPPQHFTHSKVMSWVAFDRGVRTIERFGQDGPLERWREIRDEIHREVCEKGFDPARNTFTQTYGGDALDASLLRIPLVGFLPPDDPRVAGTIRAIERDLSEDGLILRYRADAARDGLPAGEGVFLACSFWMVDALAMSGRGEEARALFERLLALKNDVGLLSEEYHPREKRLLGNFPQALSHLALVNAARNLSAAVGPAAHGQSAQLAF
jgi:GH15 family glucan-1,4-alpha-glucosidase